MGIASAILVFISVTGVILMTLVLTRTHGLAPALFRVMLSVG